MEKGKIHIIGGDGGMPGDLQNAERAVSQQWCMELERRINQLEQVINMMNMEKLGLLNMVVGFASRLENITGQKFLKLATQDGKEIPVPKDVPIPTVVGTAQALDQSNLVDGKPPAPSIEETKNVLQAQVPGDKKKVDGPELNTLTPPGMCPQECDLGACDCEGECTCKGE